MSHLLLGQELRHTRVIAELEVVRPFATLPMNDSAKSFFTDLHQGYLKPRGYKKLRHTFSREASGYTERFNFQGSAWNDSSRPWSFYINVGVEFHDLPPRETGFPGTHCSTRITRLLLDAPSQYYMPTTDQKDFIVLIADNVDQASQQIAHKINQIRSAYDKTQSSQLNPA